MLKDFPVNPVLPAQDGPRARAFYRDVLGLTLLSGPDDDPMMFSAGDGTTIVVTEIPERVPPSYPVVNFLVTDLEFVVLGLKARGATFQPPQPGTFAGQAGVVDGEIMNWGPVKSAFVRDTEGNILALNEILEPWGSSR